ncbi:hypothetical protein MKW94_001022 [Papaver nudicaule]|uniref:fructose-bisphosphatase n=1 Tax=Papaver nudicaule TaxID=74823 RepID=A0AA41SCW0_PAPNU|nr:hypothetical protein [Papaver nudicaule]
MVGSIAATSSHQLLFSTTTSTHHPLILLSIILCAKIETLTSWLLKQEKAGNIDAELTIVLSGISMACKQIASLVQRASISNLTGVQGAVNIQGERSLWLSRMRDYSLRGRGCTCCSGREFRELHRISDPLDGSSNTDAAVSTGSIFGIHHPNDECLADFDEDISPLDQEKQKCIASVCQPGKNLLAAGYCMYSCVYSFTLDPMYGEIVSTQENLQIPNLKRSTKNDLKIPNPKPYSARYIGSLVGDFHTALLYAGMFGYPRDSISISKNGKNMLLCKCATMSYLIHQHVPLYIGSVNEVDKLEKKIMMTMSTGATLIVLSSSSSSQLLQQSQQSQVGFFISNGPENTCNNHNRNHYYYDNKRSRFQCGCIASVNQGSETSHFNKQDRKGTRNIDAELTIVLSSISLACKQISSLLQRATLSNLTGSQGFINIRGKDRRKLDFIANQVCNRLRSSGHTGIIASEEEDVPIAIEETYAGNYTIVFDPIDGSSNIDTGLTTGSIIGIHNPDDSTYPTLVDDLKLGKQEQKWVVSVEVVFAPSIAEGVFSFTLDPTYGEFVLTQKNIQIPFNEANYQVYVGCLVGEIQRMLLCGRIYGNRGKASDGHRRILDIKPGEIHQRAPLFIRSPEEMEKLERYLS